MTLKLADKFIPDFPFVFMVLQAVLRPGADAGPKSFFTDFAQWRGPR